MIPSALMGTDLEGITVIAVEQAVAAPLATCRLADAGARVIKVDGLKLVVEPKAP